MDEIDGNIIDAALFGLPVAHCINGQLGLGSGVAKQLNEVFFIRKELYRSMDELRVGSVATCHRTLDDGQKTYIFNMVNKAMASGKPTYETMKTCLKNLKAVIDLECPCDILAMPRIGCGIDGLDWNVMRPMIEEIFSGSKTFVRIYNYKAIV